LILSITATAFTEYHASSNHIALQVLLLVLCQYANNVALREVTPTYNTVTAGLSNIF